MHGDADADGVLASTYMTVVVPWFAHTVLARLRAVSAWFDVTISMLEGGGAGFNALFLPRANTVWSFAR
jgi:hypothetical protein